MAVSAQSYTTFVTDGSRDPMFRLWSEQYGVPVDIVRHIFTEERRKQTSADGTYQTVSRIIDRLKSWTP